MSKQYVISLVIQKGFYFLKFYLNYYKYPGGKFKVIFTFNPFYSAKQISLASVSRSVLVPLLCLSFMCKFNETSDP